MYLKNVTVMNIRSIALLHWEIEENQASGWHVILGDNGAGKSSFIRSIALACVGPTEALALRQDWNDWIRRDKKTAFIRLTLNSDYDYDKFSGQGRTLSNFYPDATLTMSRQGEDVRLTGSAGTGAKRHVWGGKAGWFSASYGPFRRFSGGDKDYERIFYSNPKLARHLSAFGESVALTESLRWLQELQFKKLEGDPEWDILDHIINFVNNSTFLPHNVRLESVSSKGVEFVDGSGSIVPVEELSDGYRSILSMTFELVRQLAICYGPNKVFDPGDPTKVVVPGVVMIDEVDAHLHPTWQRRIGVWFRTHFPNIQFIVTTHSPLICQAAEHGTVYKLPTPGTNEEGQMIKGAELNRLLYGNILEAYSTEAFGSGITRSEASRQRTKRLAELNRKELHGELTETEEQEQNELRAMLPTTAHALSEEAAV